MTSSSNPAIERGLDTMVLVYSLLDGHPAAAVCQQFIQTQTGWFTSSLVLFEARAVLRKVYDVPPPLLHRKITQVVNSPLVLLDLDRAATVSALAVADMHGLDLSDAVLLQLAVQQQARWITTDDQRLAQACSQFGITADCPLDAGLRQQVAAWETAHLRPKGLQRILHRVHAWLFQVHPQAAQDLWSITGNGQHLP